MTDDDLIKREDALAAADAELRRYGFGELDGGRCDQMRQAIAALPAVTAPQFSYPLAPHICDFHRLLDDTCRVCGKDLALAQPAVTAPQGVVHEEQNTEQRRVFWNWLPLAYRDGHLGEEPKFTKYNMEVAHYAGWCAALAPAQPAVTPTLAEALVEKAAQDAREVFEEYGSKAREAIDYMEQVTLAALRQIGGA